MRSTSLRKCGFSFLMILLIILYFESPFIFRIIPPQIKNKRLEYEVVVNPKLRIKRRDKLKDEKSELSGNVIELLNNQEEETMSRYENSLLKGESQMKLIIEPEIIAEIDQKNNLDQNDDVANAAVDDISEATKSSEPLNLEFPIFEQGEIKYVSQLDKETLNRPEIQSQIQNLFDKFTFTNQLGRPGCTESNKLPKLKNNETLKTIPNFYSELDAPKFAEIREQNPNLRQGGAFWICDPSNEPSDNQLLNNQLLNTDTSKFPNVAILIPFRDRWMHLKYELAHLHPILQRQKLNYQIFVIEQDGRDTFNKGRLFNSGFMIVDALKKFDCIIFQDVDLLLEDDRTRYDCEIKLPEIYRNLKFENRNRINANIVKHLSTYVNSFNYKMQKYSRPNIKDGLRLKNILKFDVHFQEMSLYGGVTAMTPYQYKFINGYSNQYWGWGCEDEDLSFRLNNANFVIEESDEETGRFTMIQHKRDRGNFDNFGRFYKLMDAVQRQYHDGISNIQFKIKEIDEQPTFTHVVVNIGNTDFGEMVENYANLPKGDQNLLRKLHKEDEKVDQSMDDTVRVDEVWKFLLTSVLVCGFVVVSQVFVSKFERGIDKAKLKFFEKLKDYIVVEKYKPLSTIPPRVRKPSETHRRNLSLPRNLKLNNLKASV